MQVARARSSLPVEKPQAEASGVVDAYLFIASAEELSTAFSGWARPLPLLDHFVTRTELNPFTQEPKTVRTRIPDATLMPARNAVAKPDLARFELLGRKGLDPLDLGTVGRALLEWDEDTAHSEISGRFFVGPPDANGVLLEVPPALNARLAQLSPTDFDRVATRWADFFRKDVATIQSLAVREELLSTPNSSFVARLFDLTKVARRAVSSSRAMFLWTPS